MTIGFSYAITTFLKDVITEYDQTYFYSANRVPDKPKLDQIEVAYFTEKVIDKISEEMKSALKTMT